MKLIDIDNLKPDTPYQVIDGNLYEVEADVWAHLGEPVKIGYDVNKVVEQIQKYKLRMSTDKLPHRYFNAIGINKAVSLIKGGGIDV